MDHKEHKVSLPNNEVHEFLEQSTDDLTVKHTDNGKKYAASKYSLKATREQICHILHHHYFQIVVCVLVLLDTAVVVTEIMVETSNSNSENHNEDIMIAEKVLHYLSLSILSFFMLEITVKLFAMGLELFKHKLEIFDAVIVTVSFFLDIFLSSGGIKDGVEFLILLRLWRITRIINGIIMSVKARAEESISKLQKEKDELESKCSELQSKLTEQKKEIEFLKEELHERGFDVDKNTSNNGHDIEK